MSDWTFAATVVRVVDGDTVDMDVDLGFSVWFRGSFRLLGLNARELHMPGGIEAKDNLALLLPVGCPVALTSTKVDKYGGRFDAVLTVGGSSVNDQLIATGWAAAWTGDGVKPVPPWPRS